MTCLLGLLFRVGEKRYSLRTSKNQKVHFFEKASQLDPKNHWNLVGMYDVCYETRDYAQAIIVVGKLIEFKKEYKEDLTSLYMNTQQFDKALELINELNEAIGNTEIRDNYKASILKESKYQGSEKENLLQFLEPRTEQKKFRRLYISPTD